MMRRPTNSNSISVGQVIQQKSPASKKLNQSPGDASGIDIWSSDGKCISLEEITKMKTIQNMWIKPMDVYIKILKSMKGSK